MKYLNILIISFLICCGKQKGVKEIISTADALVIEKVLSNPIPSPPTLIYMMDKSGYIHLTDYQELKSLYSIKYKTRFMPLSKFLYLTVNQYYKLENTDFSETSNCKVSPVIEETYRNTNIDVFINKYCYRTKHKGKDMLGLSMKNLSACEIKTITYYFFQNRFMVVYDDYHNDYYFIKNENIR
ncbi:hypothetical protein [Flectobacillus roseus]|uniref:Lipoprotein n=1 Tax=Flectobacillus roseus TaxID=502259 RepID=A0ABT6YEI6_9BACT|nr:hypothetical protein [Flectobacillus roseus]MDI9861849.1 hypothetical protein [Flectobacillus roseus]